MTILLFKFFKSILLKTDKLSTYPSQHTKDGCILSV